MEKLWALVTGASSGIGLAYAKELASRGYPLVMVSNEEQAIQEKGEWIRQTYGVEVVARYQDLAIPGAAKALYEACQAEGIVVDVLVNNAGMFFFKEVVDEREVVVEKMLYLHTTTPTQLCYYFGKEMKRRGHGYILIMSSLSCWLPYPGITLYASTKRYLKSFARGLRTEMKGYGVSVSVLCPGAVATNLYNLQDNLKQLAINLGIMMRPEKLARKGINALLGKRYCLVPGLINKIFTPIVMALPHGLVNFLMRHTGLLPYNPTKQGN
mgnify:FL=1